MGPWAVTRSEGFPRSRASSRRVLECMTDDTEARDRDLNETWNVAINVLSPFIDREFVVLAGRNKQNGEYADNTAAVNVCIC